MEPAISSTIAQHQGTLGSVPAVTTPAGEQLRPLTGQTCQRSSSLRRASGLDRSASLSCRVSRKNAAANWWVFAITPLRSRIRDRHAKALIAHWLAKHAGEFKRIDVPGRAELGDWFHALGLVRIDPVAKMVRNAPAEQHSGEQDATYRMFDNSNQAMG